MEKIKVEFRSKEQLDIFISILQARELEVPKGITDKCMFYLSSTAVKKLLKKQIDKADDFSNKPFKVSFNYMEAAGLYMELSKINSITTANGNGHYEASLITKKRNELHEQL